jgi:hypothetical protein
LINHQQRRNGTIAYSTERVQVKSAEFVGEMGKRLREIEDLKVPNGTFEGPA